MTMKKCLLDGLILLAALVIGIICSVFLYYLAVFLAFGLFGFCFCFGPSLYFDNQAEICGTNAIKEKWRGEGLQLSGRVLQRWTSGDDDDENVVKVLYRTPEDEIYVTDFQVSGALRSQECLNLEILPQYPRSARIKRASIYHNDEAAQGIAGVAWSFIWVSIWNVGLFYTILINHLGDDWHFIAKYLVACEVVLVWITGYFLARAVSNDDLRTILFRAKLCNSSGELHQDQPQTPNITYQEMFPSSNKTFQVIIWIMMIDFAKFWGGILGAFYFLLFGGGHCLMTPLFIDRKMKLFLEEYLTSGEEVEGTVVHRSAMEVEVEYVVSDESLSNGQRYGKSLPVPRHRKGCRDQFEYKPVSDNPRLIILPNLPTSARLADEIEFREQIYKKGSVYMITAIIIFGLQTVCATVVIGDLLFPNVPSWGMALIYIALQLCLNCMGAILHQRFTLHRVLYNATRIAVYESIELDNKDTIESGVPLLDENGTKRLANDLSEKEVAQSEVFKTIV